MIQFRSFFIFLYISCLITFTYGDKRPILQIIGHHNLNCAANEKQDTFSGGITEDIENISDTNILH